MRRFSISDVLGYAVAAVAVGLGVVVMTGALNIAVDNTTRYVFSAIFVLIGIYRFTVTYFKAGASRRDGGSRDENR
jgi:hypothetical protein